MKRSLSLATLLLSLIAVAPTATSQKQTCSCKAPDGKCAVSVTCSLHGCTAICGSNNGCYAKCGKDLIKTSFTLKLVNKGAKEIASGLSQNTGHKIEFVPRIRDDRFTIDIKGDDLWNAMDYLNERGKIFVDTVPWQRYQEIRGVMLNGGKLSSVTFDNISVSDALAHLSFLSGVPFRIESGNAAKRLSLSLQEVTLSEIVDTISKQTDVKIEQTKSAP